MGGGAKNSIMMGNQNTNDSPISPNRNELDSPLKFQRSHTKINKSPNKAATVLSKKRQNAGQGPVRNMNTLAMLQKTQSLKYD